MFGSLKTSYHTTEITGNKETNLDKVQASGHILYGDDSVRCGNKAIIIKCLLVADLVAFKAKR